MEELFQLLNSSEKLVHYPILRGNVLTDLMARHRLPALKSYRSHEVLIDELVFAYCTVLNSKIAFLQSQCVWLLIAYQLQIALGVSMNINAYTLESTFGFSLSCAKVLLVFD